MDEQTRSQHSKIRPFLSSVRVLPTVGAACYELFSLNIIQPKRFSKFFGTRDLAAADVLWFSAHVGIGWHIYHKKHLQTLTTPWRIVYSVFGSGIFNFGTVLFWGTVKALVPKLPDGLKVLFGFSSGAFLLYIGHSYLDYVDSCVNTTENEVFSADGAD